ncbi:hypothetical protein COM13_19235 [Bacillus pseudomycoides]|jgi:hypothetical protein|uniref:Uncharacterized protein n=3 Tax=Bacillus pseudomycoides TaxID=64104 RepID=A0ABD6T6R2_9BACI|nr:MULTISPECIES: hypothetical protein [Bacillus]MBD5800395.1 hypothetical protein [Bacillus pseudomycoides]MCR8861074.1 hypothetical protein [Bacillus pseudomycoides]MED1477457.1 hypothetical protein [Bacillus pseudomycoides]MED1534422.1 hypothetical protein [Bacillus pseudomycoides]MED1624170.1 hypothetical protein [Bacillus pseudomycoides]
MKALSVIVIMGWMARVAIRVFSVGGANTMDRIERNIILFFTIMKLYIHYKKGTDSLFYELIPFFILLQLSEGKAIFFRKNVEFIRILYFFVDLFYF